ncbi:MAG TPA: hypothetical protein VFL57_19545 [Bryobacteraceae bacterium]|nr:hypothetical protein [Bryobacteraceae bacterium]
MRLVAAVCLAAALAFAGDGGRADYVGGTLPGIPSGTGGRIHATDDVQFRFEAGRNSVRIPWGRVNLLEYGLQVNRRYAMAVLVSPMFLLSKSRRHFVTVGYTDDNGKQQAMVVQVDKNDVRAVLVALEARSGQRVQFQDQEARKAGKG